MNIKWFGMVKAAEGSAISALASRRADGKTICLMVFNRHMEKDISVTVRAKGAPVAWAKCWQVTSPSLVNENADDAEMETISGEAVAVKSGAMTFKLPRFSMTAFEMGFQP
jgi:alpha-L-arabinofuranosidase